MENIKQAAIGKSRSYTACLSEANKMLFDNIRVIFGRTWIFCTVLAVVASVYVSLYLHAMLYGGNTALNISIGILSLIMLGAEIAYYARVMFLINGRPMKWNLARCANLAMCYIGFYLIVGLLYAGVTYAVVSTQQPADLTRLQPMFMAFGAASLVIAFMMLPYVYVAMKYMMEPESKLRKIIFKSYATGLRHWGLIFIALFLAMLCVAVCATLVSIPMFIVMAANMLSVYGVNFLGDPTGLPSYFTAIQIVVFAMTTFILSYISIFTVFVCYFLYGSIETREKEKNEAKKELNVNRINQP